MKKVMTFVLLAMLVAASASTGPALVQRTPDISNVERETQPPRQPQLDAEQVSFLFLYREGSIEPDSVKRMADSLDLTIKETSSGHVVGPKGGKPKVGKGKPISPTKPILTVGDIEEAFRSAGYGAKLTKADAARINSGTPIEELFKEGNSVVAFNINTNENTAQQLELPIKLQGDTAEGIEKKDIRRGMVIAKPGSISPHRVIVFTFNQTRETLEEFKEVFCKMYHNDCGGPIGKPIPLPDQVNVKSYSTKDLQLLERGPIIAPPSISIKNEEQLLNILLPYSRPPEKLVIVMEDSSVVIIDNLEWLDQDDSTNYQAMRPPKGMRYCDCGNIGKHLCPDSWSCKACCDLLKEIFDEDVKGSATGRFKNNVKIDDVSSAYERIKERLSQAGLKWNPNKDKNKVYPIDINLSDNPAAKIICMEKNWAGDCIHYRICFMYEGRERCADVVLTWLGWQVIE